MLNNKIIQKIKGDAVRLDWEVAFGGKANGNRHLFRVNKIIKYLLKKEGGDHNIAITGGWIHDVSLAWGSDYDKTQVEKRTKKFLKKYKQLDSHELEEIINCATFHESGSKFLSIEAKIVHDADVIDKSGSLGVIRHVWKMTNMIEGRIIETKADLDNLQKHLNKRGASLYTISAKRIVNKLNAERSGFFKSEKDALALIKLISSMAINGKASDKIAKFVIKNHKNSFSKLLLVQLSCGYLK